MYRKIECCGFIMINNATWRNNAYPTILLTSVDRLVPCVQVHFDPEQFTDTFPILMYGTCISYSVVENQHFEQSSQTW